MDNLTTVVFSYNNENIVENCLKSAQLLTKNVILIDQKSTDKTVLLAKRMSVTVLDFPNHHYVEPAREFGINKSTTDWVFILDADERITPELVREIRNSKFEIRKFSYYKVPRKNIFINRWLKHGGWWPDHQIRLINKKFFKAWPKEIHSTPIIDGNGGSLKQSLIHYFHGDFASMVNKTIIFEDIESDLLYNAGKKATTLTFFRKFLAELCRRLFKNLGFLDGSIGIIESIYQAFSKTITYLLLYEKKKNSCSV